MNVIQRSLKYKIRYLLVRERECERVSVTNHTLIGIFNASDLFSVPVCVCIPPSTGRGCEVTIPCPQGASLAVCSSYGNTSVTYMFNGTETGLGW